MQFQVQLILPDRQRRSERLQLLEVFTNRSGSAWGCLWMVLPELHLLQHFPGRSTAVVSHTRHPQRLIHACFHLELLLFLLHGQRVGIRADAWQHQRQQLRTSTATPAEHSMREAVCGIPGKLVRAEPAHACGTSNGRQPASESETVRQPGQVVTPLGELSLTGLLTQCELPPERGCAHQNTVGFNPGAVDGLPASLTAGLLNPCKQRGAVALHPFVESWGGVGEMQLRETLHQLQGRTEGAFRRLPGVSDRP